MVTHNFYTKKDGQGFELFINQFDKICFDIVNENRLIVDEYLPILCFDVEDIKDLINVLKSLVKEVSN